MLKNEFQSMIEQYSNELMNISRHSGEEIPANAQADLQEEDVPASVQPVSQEKEIPANAQPVSQEKEIPANAQPVSQEKEIAASVQSTLQKEEITESPQTIPVQNPNIMQSPAMPPQQNAGQPRDIPLNPNNAAQAQPPVPNNIGQYRDDSANMTYEQFLSENPGSGLLKVQVFSGQQVTPIPNAEVVVSKELLDGNRVFFSGLTDISGIVDGIQLPAPIRELSESPQPRGDGVALQLPYSQYNVTIKEPRYRTQEYTHVPIFDGIKSIQPVRMTPIQFANGNNGNIVFPESEPNTL